jgi:UDP-N-acetylmuramoyl-tripeptide--D-alanyl-D-alanine ligase
MDGCQPGGANARPPESTDGAGMQVTADELRGAIAGQWVVAPPVAAARPGFAPAPFLMYGVGTDTREDLAGRLFVALRGESFDAHAFLAQARDRGAVAAVVDRRAGAFERPEGFPLIEVGDTRVALGDLARWWRGRLRAKTVAITGSSGKTTTRRLVDAVLSRTMRGTASPKSFNNDIGVPLTILGASATDGYLVVESGMNHPGEIAPLSRMAAPQVAIVTMAGRAHLGGMGSVEAIVAEKSSLVDGLGTLGIAIVNGDQPALVAAVESRVKPGVRVVTFGRGEGCQWRLVDRAPDGELQRVSIAGPGGDAWSGTLGLPGEYNAMNALAAAACARMLGVPWEAVAEGFAAIRPESMRMTRQPVGDVVVFNDAYNANPDAVAAALGAFAELAPDPARRVTVLGDMLELGEASAACHRETARAAVGVRPSVAVFVGPESRHGADEARSLAGPATEVVHVDALDDAGVRAIAARLLPGDHLLLKGSRGSRMERLVQALSARAAAAAGAAAESR